MQRELCSEPTWWSWSGSRTTSESACLRDRLPVNGYVGHRSFRQRPSVRCAGGTIALLEDGTADGDATQVVPRSFAYAVDDPDNGACFWTGLAATQMQLGRLDQAVRDRTIAVIDAGGDLHMWDDPGLARKRKTALAKLRGQLLGPQRAPVKVRPARRVPCPVQAGDLFLLTVEDGRKARLRCLAVMSHRMGDLPTVEMIDERGRPYRFFYPADDIFATLATGDESALWQIVEGRMNDVPSAEDIQVVAQQTPAQAPPEGTRSMGWRGLRIECARLLDEPNALPQGGLFGAR